MTDRHLGARPQSVGVKGPELHTSRLVLRRWRGEDLDPVAELNADPKNMVYFPAPLDRRATEQFVARNEECFDTEGVGLWALALRKDGTFLGSVGLLPVKPNLPFFPGLEVGWRLHRRHWGRGYATEAAEAALHYGFVDTGVSEIVSFTAAINRPSRAVMERLGMHRNSADDFVFPGIPVDDRLQPHVLYRLSRAEWSRRAAVQL